MNAKESAQRIIDQLPYQASLNGNDHGWSRITIDEQFFSTIDEQFFSTLV